MDAVGIGTSRGQQSFNAFCLNIWPSRNPALTKRLF